MLGKGRLSPGGLDLPNDLAATAIFLSMAMSGY
jgi:hypothetical protein